MAVKASQVKVLDLTSVATTAMEATINAAIEALEAAGWVIQSQHPAHVVNITDGTPKFLYFVAYQKHEVLP